MVNTIAKIKKTQNTLKPCFLQASTMDSDHLSTHSGALIGSNDDLLTEILPRLPVASIFRFKSVSKHWRSLLSHKRYTFMYYKLLISRGLFIRNMYVSFDIENQSTPPFHTLDFYPDVSGIRIIQSCNGLLLCCSDRGSERSRKYYVFNPTTKQFVVIPSVPGGRDVRKTICFMGLAFHQGESAYYKVVCIHRSNTTHNESLTLFHIQIYSTKTCKWKISDNHFYAPNHTTFTNGVYWNGAIHWAPSYLNPSYFDLNVEEVKNLPLPSSLPIRVASLGGYANGNLPYYFGESRGHMHLVDTAHHETHISLNVYEMSGDHSGWFVKFKVELDDIPNVYPDLIQSEDPSSPHLIFEVIDVVRGEVEEDTFMVLKILGKIIRYNVKDKSFKQLCDLSDVYQGRIDSSRVHRHIQSSTLF